MAVSRLCKNARDEILTGIREKEDNMASTLARGKVAQLWCATETDSLVLNPILAEKFAELQRHRQKAPHLIRFNICDIIYALW